MSTNEAFTLQPVLEGPTIKLRPLRKDDFDALYAAASDPLIWEQHPARRYELPVFKQWFEDSLASGGALVVIDKATDTIIGSSRYYDWDPEKKEIAIGFTFLARRYWGGATNREMKRLMLDHAFKAADTVWFHVDVTNIRSAKAMEKIGATLSHRAVKPMAGSAREYLFFKIEKGQPY